MIAIVNDLVLSILKSIYWIGLRVFHSIVVCGLVDYHYCSIVGPLQSLTYVTYYTVQS